MRIYDKPLSTKNITSSFSSTPILMIGDMFIYIKMDNSIQDVKLSKQMNQFDPKQGCILL